MIYVYKLPEPDKLADGYAFGGGKQIPFLNVDWRNSIEELPDMQGFTQDDETRDIAQKSYAQDGQPLLIIDTHNLTSRIIKFSPCSICNRAGMEKHDICAACGRISLNGTD